MLTIQKLACGYHNKIVLEDINIRITRGELAGIIGPNGSGKTTLLRAITKIITPSSGEVIFKNKDVRQISYKELAKQIAVVSQDAVPDLYEMRVEEYVALGRIPHRKSFQFFDEAHDAEITEKAMEFTDVLKIRERPINELSSGERQRVFVARALAQEPELLLLDEPTSHLDIGHQIELMELIKDLNKNKGLTVIAVLHDLNLASSYCSRLILMNNGRICKQGTAEEVLTYQNIEEVYKTVVVVEKSPITKKPHIFVAPR